MNVPARLDMILDEIGVGAMLKHLETNRRALVIDFHPATGAPIVVMIREEWVDREDGESAHKPEHYEVLVLGETKKGKVKKLVGGNAWRGKRKKKASGSGWRFVTSDLRMWLVLEAGHDRLLDHVEDP